MSLEKAFHFIKCDPMDLILIKPRKNINPRALSVIVFCSLLRNKMT